MARTYGSLSEYLAATGQTQEALAAALGISQPAISGYVAGHRMPRPALALRLSKHTGVPVEALLRARVGNVA